MIISKLDTWVKYFQQMRRQNIYCVVEASDGITVVTVVVCQSLLSPLDVATILVVFEVASTLYGTENDIKTSPSFCLRTV